jgi:endonuclease/exonuclease/phosphatase family metal-dependent hydrolase
VSYNVRYFGHALKGLASTRSSERRIAARLAALAPLADVICLQEIETISVRSRMAHGRGEPGETQLKSFLGELERAFVRSGQVFPYDGFYFRAHVNRIRGLSITTHGLAILANTRRLKVESHNVAAPARITHHHVELFRDRKQGRICAHMRLSDPAGRRLHVFNTHLSLPTPFARAFWTRRARMGWGVNQLHEARSLAAYVHRHARGGPFVVCGDFNSTPGSPVFRYLSESAGFRCAEEDLGLIDDSPYPTAGFMRLRMHLDHIFYGNGVRFLDLEGTARYGDRSSAFAGLSDHVPLIGRLRWDGAEGR